MALTPKHPSTLPSYTEERTMVIRPWDELKADLKPVYTPFTPAKLYPKVMFLKNVGLKVM